MELTALMSTSKITFHLTCFLLEANKVLLMTGHRQAMYGKSLGNFLGVKRGELALGHRKAKLQSCEKVGEGGARVLG